MPLGVTVWKRLEMTCAVRSTNTSVHEKKEVREPEWRAPQHVEEEVEGDEKPQMRRYRPRPMGSGGCNC